MERIFKPQNEAQKALVEIITKDKDKRNRKKAMNLLRNIFNADLYSLRSIEYYHSIIGKPKYFRRFNSATIVYDDTKLKIN